MYDDHALAALSELLSSRVSRTSPDGCWKWEGPRHRDGYGIICVDGHNLMAHRVAWILANPTAPPLTKKEFICHYCNVKACVNPKHLYKGDIFTNAMDGVRKRRWARYLYSK